MDFIKMSMTKDMAESIVKWKYGIPYDLYSFNDDKETIDELLDGDYFSIHAENLLVGYYCIGKSAQVPTTKSLEIYKKTDYIDIGLGLKPSLTNIGCGTSFVEFILQCVKQDYLDKRIRLCVASFNKRAIKVYEKNGFKFLSSFIRDMDDKEFIIMTCENI